jgi:hypothetical protein
MATQKDKKDAQHFIAEAIESALLIGYESKLLEVPSDLYWEIERIRKALHKKWGFVWHPNLAEPKDCPFK